MLVSELFNRLDNGENMKTLCSELNIHPSTMQRKLKKLGYTFNSSLKRWEWNGQEKEQADINLLETIKKPVSSRVNSISPTIHLSFTQDEIKSLKKIIKEWNRGSKNIKQIPNRKELYERIKTLNQEEKTRKTIVVNKSISQALDEFTKQEKLNKSDVLHLALEDFIKTYSS